MECYGMGGSSSSGTVYPTSREPVHVSDQVKIARE